MISMTKRSLLVGSVALVLAMVTAPSAQACAACFGKSDSPLAFGMNMGIFSLLAVIVSVLVGVAGFFVYLSRRGARYPEATASLSQSNSETSNQVL